MPNPLAAALAALKKALLKLNPTGPDGFEGLLATALSDISNQAFRLANSGLQGGHDGDADEDDGHIAFEAKLYTRRLDRNDVLAKIAETIGSSRCPDLWILGATVSASSQLRRSLEAAARVGGVATLFLDWPPSAEIPPLAVLCAEASRRTLDFLGEHIDEPPLLSKVENALQIIRTHSRFVGLAAALRQTLSAPTLGLSLALEANREWFTDVLGNRRQARRTLGQALAPLDRDATPVLPRIALAEAVKPRLQVRPSGEILALLGQEGAGKSWLFAESWLAIAEPPLTIWISATDVAAHPPASSLVDLFIDKLITQTGDSPDTELADRWKVRFRRWKHGASPNRPNLVVCIDGLNQNTAVDWARWLDGAAEILERHGGVLVVTARASFFDDRVRTALQSAVQVVSVPEWSDAELAQILTAKTLDISEVAPAVRLRLRNPRLLGVALRLLDAKHIGDLVELTVERLLFEHIRTGAREGFNPENVDDFVHRLSRHALDVIARIKAQERDDRLIFPRATSDADDHRLSAALLAVSSEQFFRPVDHDPTLYSLTEHGLALALGLAIIKALQKAERNRRDVADALDELIDPIAALDKTSEAVLSALLVASIDPRCSTILRTALIGTFVRLQNVEEAVYPAFAAAIGEMIDPALDTLEQISTSRRHTAQLEWLKASLHAQRDRPEGWAIVTTRLKRWLGVYSLSPALSVSASSSEPEKYAEALEANEQEVQKRWSRLAEQELAFFTKSMTRLDEVDPAALVHIGYDLLVGAPLADFAEAFIAAGLSQALNSSLRSPYDAMLALIRFNSCDWTQTRQALLSAAVFLQAPDASITARWALVAILRGLSTEADSTAERELVDELTKDYPPSESWRRVETYCATDPCDPASTEPDNITETAEQYRQIDIKALASSTWVGIEDHHLRDARTGLARFRPEAAIDVHRAFARSALAREREALRRAVHSLDRHSAVLDRAAVERLLAIARELSSPADDDSDATEEAWTISQSALVVAFPHLDGDEQLRVLMGLPPHGTLLINLGETFRPASEGLLDQAFEAAGRSGNPHRKCAALLFARRSGTKVSQRARQFIGQFTKDDVWVVRSEAMCTIAKLDDVSLIRIAIDSDWSAQGLDPRKRLYEIHHGSSVMIRSVELGILSVEAAIARISPARFAAASRLGSQAATLIADHLDAAVRKAIRFEPPFTPPFTERRIPIKPEEYPASLILTQRDRDQDTLSDFRRAQKAGWESFDKFDAALTRENARLIVEDIGFNAIEACVAARPDWGFELTKTLLAAPAAPLRQVRSFGFKLARAMSGTAPDAGAALARKLGEAQGVTGLVFGAAKIPLAAMCVWGGHDNPTWDNLRFARLDRAKTDQEIAQEMLAALLCGKSDCLSRYVQDRLARPEPVANARALMVLGLGEPSDLAEEHLTRRCDAPGFIGEIAASATYAYVRNQWAKHWFALMTATDDRADYWRFSAMFLKIVDGRFEFWEPQYMRSPAAVAFEPGLASSIRERISSWGDKRKKTLFGEGAPPPSYIECCETSEHSEV